MLRELTITVRDDNVVIKGLIDDGLDGLALLILRIFLVITGSRASANQKRVVESSSLLFRGHNY